MKLNQGGTEMLPTPEQVKEINDRVRKDRKCWNKYWKMVGDPKLPENIKITEEYKKARKDLEHNEEMDLNSLLRLVNSWSDSARMLLEEDSDCIGIPNRNWGFAVSLVKKIASFGGTLNEM